MIFKTTDDGGLTNIFKELKSVQVTFEELDKTTLRSAIKSFNNTSISVEDLSKRFGGLDNSVVEYLNNTERGQASMDGLSKSIDNSAISMISATAKAKILAIALNALTGLAISLAFKGITWAIDELIVTLDEQKEKLDEAVTAYEESKSELEKINDELKTTSERIDELNGKENLTFTEQDELEKLIKTNDELERKIYLLEQANKEAEKEVVTEAQNTYDKYTNNRTLGAVEQIEFYSDSSLLEGVNWDNFKGDLSWLVAQYKNQEEILANAQANGWTNIEERAKSNLELLEGYMSEASLDYQDLYDKIGGISDFAMTEDLELAKQDLDDILDIVAEILGYGGQRSETSFDDIWNSEDFSQYKTELETLAKEGKLDASVLESNEQYKKLLEDTGATAESTAEHIKALVAETEQAETQNPDKITVLNITQTVDQIDKQLKPALDSLGETYKTIFEQPFNLENVDTVGIAKDLKDEFDELSKAGITINNTAYEDFVKVLSDTSSTADDVKSAFNELATAITDVSISGIEDFDVLKKSLSDLGVVNDVEIALVSLAKNEEILRSAGLDLSTATQQDIIDFVSLYGEAENLSQAIQYLTYQKMLNAMTDMDTTEEVSNLLVLAKNAGITGEAISHLTELEILYQEISSGTLDADMMTEYQARADELVSLIKSSATEFKPKVEFTPTIDTKDLDKSAEDAAKAAKETLESTLELYKTELDAGIIDLDTYLKKCNDLLNDARDKAIITGKEYWDYQKEVAETQKDIYDKVLSAINHRYDKEISSIEKVINALEKQNEALEKQLAKYDSAISAITKFLDTQKDLLQDNIDGIEAENDVIQDEIDGYDQLLNAVTLVIDAKREAVEADKQAIQDRIDALREENDEAKRAYELEQARFELERLRNSRTKKLYVQGQGYIFDVDHSAIREQEDSVADLELDATTSALEKEQELLDNILEQLDAT